MIGQKIQNYNVEELLGEGGMGTVYRATDTLLQRSVAVKILHPHLVRDTTFFERFRNEAILSAKLNHSNVAVLYNFLRDRNDNFMVMEFVDGMTLEKLLKQNGGLPLESVLKIMMQTLDGLHHAHEKGILHRDIKPANLMLTREGIVKLMDFGIARMVGSQRLTRADRIVGTLEYMAPELLDGSEPSVQSDLYAIGILMYELLSGKMPFEASTDSTLITQILTKKPIPLRTRIGNLPKKVEEILDTLLQKKPERRFESAADLRHILSTIVTPGRVVPQTLQPKKVEVNIAPTEMYTKANTNPTRLADHRQQRASGSNSTVVQTVRSRMLSTEGMILGGAVLAALMIVIVGVFFMSPKKSDKNEQAENFIPTTTLVIPQPVATTDSQKVSNNDVGFQQPLDKVLNPIEKKETKPKETLPIDNKEKTKDKEKTKQPIEKKEEEKKKEEPKPTPSEPIAKQPVTEPVKELEPVREEPKAKVTRNVTVRGLSVAVVLDETISSNDPGIKGKSINLRVLSDIRVDGIVVIAAGARATAKVTSARSSDAGKSFLEFRPERVQAVNGDWVSLKSPELGKSGSSTEAVVFTRGMRILPDPKTANTILTITL
ncbi:serine/threonine-protein kinase [Emticicia sp. C21]|uniref:serine/threonine protein kinase n=1 Tax=Emticicia sp. C21 TaxID=2302915 RepID=UPI000E34A046|nr:serine/threonine-protein kinase [Emticicia sp. C21]RFS16959.1 serine/threonine protein kinase [Emticicia sp. C21]